MQVSKVIKAHGLSQAEVAEKMGIECVTLRNTISKGNFTLKTLRAIASAVGCSVVEFFADEVEAVPAGGGSASAGGAAGVAEIVCPKCGERLAVSLSVEQ